MLQAALWPSLGYRQATLTAVFAGFVVVFVVGLYAIIQSSVLALCLALFICMACHRQWVVLEIGGEEGVFGYDFSQGYTSLERDQMQAAPPRAKVSWWRRWLQKRTARRVQREMEQREAEERRLDELLEKINRHGRGSLTEEEERFMKRVSAWMSTVLPTRRNFMSSGNAGAAGLVVSPGAGAGPVPNGGAWGVVIASCFSQV